MGVMCKQMILRVPDVIKSRQLGDIQLRLGLDFVLLQLFIAMISIPLSFISRPLLVIFVVLGGFIQ